MSTIDQYSLELRCLGLACRPSNPQCNHGYFLPILVFSLSLFFSRCVPFSRVYSLNNYLSVFFFLAFTHFLLLFFSFRSLQLFVPHFFLSHYIPTSLKILLFYSPPYLPFPHPPRLSVILLLLPLISLFFSFFFFLLSSPSLFFSF